MTRVTRRDVLAAGAAAAASSALGLGGAGCRGKPDVVVGSKDFQEQWILADLIAELIARDTPRSTGRKDLAGTFPCHQAIRAGEIHCYVEYSGTAFTAVLEHPPIADAAEVYRRVQADYAARFDLLVLPPLGFENTFALLVRRRAAAEHGLRSISDLRKVQASFVCGFGFEFYDRADGYRGLVAAYELELAKRPIQMELGNTYRALEAGQVDLIVGNSTDGLIDHLDLVALEDDRHYFPPYQAGVVVRQATADRHPDILAVLRRLSGKISTDAIRAANYAVDHDKRPTRAVARDLLATVAPAP